MAIVRRAAVVHYLRRMAAGSTAAGLSDAQLLARFAGLREESAFEALVQRHGAMVLGVCRRVARDWHRAEDAFQATFLVLARKAGTLHRPERLAAWLHGVACRTARKARAEATRRTARERQAARGLVTPPPDHLEWSEVRDVLDQEIGRLPARCRAAFVLCYLEGKTNAEAAAILGCPRGSVATLLARARERLRRRLAQRGLAPPAETPPAVPVLLAEATVQAGVAAATGKGIAAATSAAALAEGVLRSMMLSKWKVAGWAVLVAVLAGLGAARTASSGETPGVAEAPALEKRQTVSPPAAAPEDEEEAEASFRTEHFVVVAPSRAVARKVGLAAERLREDLALKWLGRELPPWPDLMPIRITTTTGGIGGASSFAFDQQKIVSQQMHLQGPVEALLQSSLPHEMTHVILAHWARRPVPRWADEGAAVLGEDLRERTRHLRRLAQILADDKMIPLRQLFSLQDFPRDADKLYCEGYSVTAYLVARGGRAKFLEFLRHAFEWGWDRALVSYYDIGDVDQLQRLWLADFRKWALGVVAAPEEPTEQRPPRKKEVQPAPAAAPAASVEPEPPQVHLPAGPGPSQVLVELLEDGRLNVWRPATTYRREEADENHRGPIWVQVQTLARSECRLQDIKVYDMAGRQISRKKLPKLLDGRTVVLTLPAGEAVDPLHLRLDKEGTLLFVLPPPAAVPIPPPVDMVEPPGPPPPEPPSRAP
jgi:RNA polymerase sigma factor (sigma-70 family)